MSHETVYPRASTVASLEHGMKSVNLSCLKKT